MLSLPLDRQRYLFFSSLLIFPKNNSQIPIYPAAHCSPAHRPRTFGRILHCTRPMALVHRAVIALLHALPYRDRISRGHTRVCTYTHTTARRALIVSWDH